MQPKTGPKKSFIQEKILLFCLFEENWLKSGNFAKFFPIMLPENRILLYFCWKTSLLLNAKSTTKLENSCRELSRLHIYHLKFNLYLATVEHTYEFNIN